MERQCAEIRLRAERRIGELLAGTVRPGSRRTAPSARPVRPCGLGIAVAEDDPIFSPRMPPAMLAEYDFLRARPRTPISRHRTTHRIDFGQWQTNKAQATRVLPPIHRHR